LGKGRPVLIPIIGLGVGRLGMAGPHGAQSIHASTADLGFTFRRSGQPKVAVDASKPAETRVGRRGRAQDQDPCRTQVLVPWLWVKPFPLPARRSGNASRKLWSQGVPWRSSAPVESC
jgi:hypothetical protein